MMPPFEGSSESESHVTSADYALRSPHPTFHFLREKDVLAALQSGYPNPEEIPARNAVKLDQVGLAELRRGWAEMKEEGGEGVE
mmetsp:Transcript_10085/g.15785  ORF Transcript_10085/g.15785 Transcript_10085/m.15785 type:complete len:84 (+) Transcript_10085:296-547(+)